MTDKARNMISLMIAFFLVFAFGGMAARAADTPVWQTVGDLGFSPGIAEEFSLFISENGVPYVVNVDADSKKATAQKFNGVGWTNAGVELSAGPAHELSFHIDNNIPYAAYSDGSNANRAMVKKYNAAAQIWDPVGNAGFTNAVVANTSSDQADLSLFVYNGTPYIAYSDGANSGKLTVQKFNGNDWEVVGGAAFSLEAATNIDLVVYQGTPYVAFTNAGWANTTVMKYNGAIWEPVGNANLAAGGAASLSLHITASGIPYVAYCDLSNAKPTIKRYIGTAWEIVGDQGPIPSNIPSGLSMTMYDGIPYISYNNAGKVSVMKYNGIAWEYVGTSGFSDAGSGKTSICIFNGIPYVAYSEADPLYRLSVKKYADPDMTAPQFIAGYPQFSNLAAEEFTIMFKTNEPCVVYYKWVADGSPAPTLAEIKLGANTTIEAADTEVSMRIWNLTETNYDVYVIAEDDTGNITPPIKLDAALGESTDECFIATAAYGSKYQPAVRLLRHFRDDFLMQTSPGRAFVTFYYKSSPPLAAFIANHEGLKAMIRLLLTPVVAMVYLLYHPLLAVAVLFIIAILWFIHRRKQLVL